MTDYLTEAEYLDDLYTDYDPEEFDEETLTDIRQRRIDNMDGAIVICCDSRYNQGQKLYLQNKKYGNQHWTLFMPNARTFHSKEQAQKVLKFFHYNNPCIRRIVNGKLRKVK